MNKKSPEKKTELNSQNASDFLTSAMLGGADSFPNDIEGLSEAFKVFSASTSKMEEMYERLEERVTELTEELEHKNRELEQANRLASLGELSAGVAHEIRNPLAGIELSATLLKRSLPDEKRPQELVHNIVESVGRINSIVMNLLTFARGAKIEARSINIEKILIEAKRAVEIHIKDDIASVSLDIADNIPTLFGDAGQLRQVFINLIQNGIDAMSGTGKMLVSVSVLDNDVKVSFCDSGVGMDKEMADRIFNPFYTTKDSGTGLGLAITYRIVENHGGRIQVETEKAKGSVFTVLLPLSGNNRDLSNNKRENNG